MREQCDRFDVDIWAWCLMPNHSHLIAVPKTEDGLRRALGEAHRRYTLEINQREGWQGHLWQGRFFSAPMDERYTLAAARYIELNPVRAGIVERPEDYPWSSARAHLAGRDDALVRAAPLLAMVPDWARFLGTALPDEEMTALRAHLSTGRPLGSDAFVDELEIRLDRPLRPQKPGPLPMLEEELVPSDPAAGRAA